MALMVQRIMANCISCPSSFTGSNDGNLKYLPAINKAIFWHFISQVHLDFGTGGGHWKWLQKRKVEL